MFNFYKSASLIAILIASPGTLAAQQIELRSSDGLVSIEGVIQSYDGTLITVETTYGVANIPVNDLECIGAACPPELVVAASPVAQDTNLTVAFADSTRRDLVVNLLGIDHVSADIDLTDPSNATVRSRTSGETATLQLLEAGDGTLATLNIASQGNGTQNAVAFGSVGEWANPEPAQTHHLALEALNAFIGFNTGVEAIRPEDLARIYAGEITNWSELGGNDQRIQPIQVSAGTRDHDNLIAGVMVPWGRSIASNVMTVQDNSQGVSMLPIIPGAIVVLSQYTADGVDILPILDACGHQVDANDYTVNLGTYPLTVSTYARFADAPEGSVIPALFNSAASRSTQEALLGMGMVDQSIIRATASEKAARLVSVASSDLPADQRASAEALLELLSDADELSIRFHDGEASTGVGSRYRADFTRLASAIETGDFDGQDLMFIGIAPADAGAAQAQQSAQTLIDAFATFAPEAAARDAVSFLASGHTSGTTPFCSINSVGQPATQIEVWVRPAL